jgi:hypothetical protein
MRGTYFHSSIRLHGVVRALLMKHQNNLIWHFDFDLTLFALFDLFHKGMERITQPEAL